VESYRELALDAARWVLARTVPVGGGRALPAEERPDEVADNLYGGGASVLALAAELALDAGGVDDQVVLAVRDRLVDRVGGPGDDGLYRGVAGYAAALLAWWEVTGDPVARVGVDAAVARLAETWTVAGWPAPTGRASCGTFLDVVSGAAGIALVLARIGTVAALALAERACDLLVRHAIETGSGLEWLMATADDERMPGFSHGTAGAATACAIVGTACGRPDLVAAARRGADQLRSLRRPGVGFTTPNVIPPAPGLEPVSHGWCHGGAGTARLFWTIEDLDTVDACLLAVRRSGLPRPLRPGFWDNLGRCCGSAGVGDAMLDRHRQTGDPELLAFADVLASDIAARAIRDADGARWSFTAYDVDGRRELPPSPGWMQGAAGIAGFLLRHARAHRLPGNEQRIAWPDAPDGARPCTVR